MGQDKLHDSAIQLRYRDRKLFEDKYLGSVQAKLHVIDCLRKERAVYTLSTARTTENNFLLCYFNFKRHAEKDFLEVWVTRGQIGKTKSVIGKTIKSKSKLLLKAKNYCLYQKYKQLYMYLTQK